MSYPDPQEDIKLIFTVLGMFLLLILFSFIAFATGTIQADAKTQRTQAIAYGQTCGDIQNTINNSATGTTIYLVGAEYICDTKLQFNGKAMNLVGTNGTKLVAQGQIGGLIYDFVANPNVEVSGIIFDVNSQSNVTGISTGAGLNLVLRNITVTNCKDIWCIRIGDLGASSTLTMNKVTVSSSTNSTFESVLVMNTNICQITNNTFTNLTQAPAALALYVGATNCVVKNNHYASNTIRDFYSSGADNFVYTRNKTTASPNMPITARGVQIFNTRNAVFSWNDVEGQNDGYSASGGFIIYDYNVGLDGHNTGAWASSSNIIIENNIINKSYSAVSIPCMPGDDKHYEKRNIIIRNNIIIDPLWKAVDVGCPKNASNMTNIDIIGNRVQGTTKVFDGGNFSITGASSSSITNVTIRNNIGLRSSAGGNSSCIYLTGVSNVITKGNDCAGVAKGIYKDIEIDASTTASIIIK